MATTSATGKEGEERTFRARALTAGILFAIFILAMFIRCYWYYGPAVAPADTYGPYHYVVSGNDPDYHKRAIDFALDTGHMLSWDPITNYPAGAPNPNPPTYEWSSMMLGILISPAFHFDVTQAVWMFFEASPAFWAALTIVPVYFFTRDMFNRKSAYFAAFFIAVMAGNVERTPLGFSDHDAFIMFFVTTGFFFLMRALRNLDDRTWVKKWRNPRDISVGVAAFFRQERVSVLYSVLAALCISTVMLAWKGITYVYAILIMYYIVHAWVKRFRKEDPFGISMIILLTLSIPLLLSFPYYFRMEFIHWFDDPFFIFLALAVIAAVTTVTREQPWIVVLVGLVAILATTYLALLAFFPSIYGIILGFQGYFIHDKLYQTIAEAQPPDFSRMVYSYGEYVFYFGLVALIISAWRLPKERWRNDYIFTIMWCIMAIYMAMSAVRFMYNATPVFAILGGWVTWTIMKLLDYKKMAKTYKGLNEGRWIPRWHAVKSSVKVRHVVGAIFIGYMVMGSCAWYGLDAGIPYETKKQFDQDIYNFLPAQIRPAGYSSSSGTLWWFGSFGTAFPGDYWTDGLFWFQTQDTNQSIEDRPGFVAWWDYGHWCTHMGQHPTVADNFQQGVEISGDIITANNETNVIADFIARSVEPNTQVPGSVDSNVKAILERYLGPDGTKDFLEMEQMTATPKWRAEILKHPDIFGKRTRDINDLNVKWTALAGLMTSRLDKLQLIDIYDEMMSATGHQIRYFAADSRMFPFQARNTGIYYAPVKLSDQDINSFLKTTAVGNDGQEYDPAHIPLEKRQDKDFKITDYKLYYLDPFYNSLFYKAYIGYSPADAGISPGTYGYTDIPSLVGNMRTGQYPTMQGWNMSNFRLEYRTAYWNPYNQSNGLANHSADWKVVPPWTAAKDQTDNNGVVDLYYRNLYQGVFFLKYYSGAYVNGTVHTDDGKPIYNARVTVYDDLPLAASNYPGVPHGYTFTDRDGRYSILAPYGNVTVKVTDGGVNSVDDLLLEKESRELGSSRFYVSDDQAMRRDIDLNNDGILDYNIRNDITVNTSALNGRAFIDSNGDGSWTAANDMPVPGDIEAANATLGLDYHAPVAADGTYLLLNLTPADYQLTLTHEGVAVDGGTVGVNPGTNQTRDIMLNDIHIEGNVTGENGTPAGGIMVGVRGDGDRVLWSNLSQPDGSFWVEDLLPGSYNLSVVSDGYLRFEIPVTVNQSANISLGLPAVPVYKTGGSTLPGAVVAFASTEYTGTGWVTATADSSGHYEAFLSPGNYSVYVRAVSGDTMFVNMSPYAAPAGASNLDIQLVQGIRLNGTVFRDLNGNGTYDPYQPQSSPTPGTGQVPNLALPEYQGNASLEIEGDAGLQFLPANVVGYYELWLPAGQYTARAFINTSETAAYVNITRFSLADTLQLNLSLGPGARVGGTVFWDRNKNDVPESGEAVAEAKVVFTERKRPENNVEAFTSPNGTYLTYLPQITDYTVDVGAFGFTNSSDFLTTGTDNLTRDFKLEPINPGINVSLTVDGKSAPAGLVGHFVAGSTGATDTDLTTDAAGVLTGHLIPGTYRLNVLQNVTLADGLANLTMSQDINITVGAESVNATFPLTHKVYVSGIVFYDENGDGVAQRTEYRNSLIKLVLESARSDPAASAPGIPTDPDIVSQGTTDGFYDVMVVPGNYTLWSLLTLSTPQGPDLVYMKNVKIDASGTINISLAPGCDVRGLVYVDLNSNGKYDSGESRNGVGVALSDGSGPLLTLASDVLGYIEVTLPQGQQYLFNVDNTTSETVSTNVFAPIRYLASANITAPALRTFQFNLSVVRQVAAAGTVSYDRNGNGLPDPGEWVSGATVVFTDDAGNSYSAVTNETGNYSAFVPEKRFNLTVLAPGFNSTVKDLASVTVSLNDREFDPLLQARNATLSLTVFPPGSGRAPSRLPGGASVSLRALDTRGVNATGKTDAQGRLDLSVSPGIYSLQVTTATYIYFGPLDVEPSGAPLEIEVNLTPAARVWGSTYYNDTEGNMVRPGWINFTFNTTLNVSGANYSASLEFDGQPAIYELRVPAGNYTATALYSLWDGSFMISYNASNDLDIGLNDTAVQWDIALAKVKDHSIGLGWDESQKATIGVNSTVNYSVVLTNLGNEKFTVKLAIAKPGGWTVNASTTAATLGVGENITVDLGITAPANANAGDNLVTINATSSELPHLFFNVSRLSVHVAQMYGVQLLPSSTSPTSIIHGASYSFKLANQGNGQDTFNLTVDGPHGWNLTLSDYNPSLTGGASKDLTLTAIPFAGARIEKGLTAQITASSKNSQAPPAVLTVNLTFPKLNAGQVKFSGPGASEPAGNPLPGFDALLMLAALGGAAVALRRRWAR
jgi:dolichyl-diphosphooligosaccharide--protein glycosyltransferase